MIIFSTNQIEELKDHSIKERQEVMAKAMKKLTVPEKLILNIMKLALLTPPFIYLARQDWGTLIISLLGVSAAYFLIMRPTSLMFARKYIE